VYVKITEGVSAASVHSWHLPISDHCIQKMPISKLISRSQLCLSKTLPLFEVADVRVVPDIKSKTTGAILTDGCGEEF
jgi:hypothetical protein